MIKKLERKKLVKKPAMKMTETEKVDARREEVLAKGRKFKYPLQYAKHKLVINTIIISVVAVVLLVVTGWWMLFKQQSSNDIIYRITRVLPISVAKVDGENVRFSDYLMYYRSNIEALERQSGTLGDDESSMGVKKDYKRAALTEVEKYVFAYKIAKEKGITVSKEEINEAFDVHRNVGGVERSEENFLKVLDENFGLNKKEYLRMIELSIYKKKVQMEIDDDANNVAKKVEKMLKENGNDFRKVAKELGKAIEYEATGGLVDNKNIDGGRATMALSMKKGEVSEKFLSSNGDGYYYVKLDNKDGAKVEYESIKIPFLKLDEIFGSLDGVEEYIEI